MKSLLATDRGLTCHCNRVGERLVGQQCGREREVGPHYFPPPCHRPSFSVALSDGCCSLLHMVMVLPMTPRADSDATANGRWVLTLTGLILVGPTLTIYHLMIINTSLEDEINSCLEGGKSAHDALGLSFMQYSWVPLVSPNPSQKATSLCKGKSYLVYPIIFLLNVNVCGEEVSCY